MTNPGYLLGRAVGHVACLLARPVAPFAESALAGVLDGLFGEPDAMDDYTPTPEPGPVYDAAHEACLRSVLPIFGEDPHEDPTWTLERDRIDQIAGNA